MERKYSIIESVGTRFETVHSYRDLEKHHPTWKEDHIRRLYGIIDAEREEYVRAGSERLVSKDFVLQVGGESRVDVPSPLTGYVRRSPELDRWGTVEIYDGPGRGAQLIGRIRHMDPIHVVNGGMVTVGEPLGVQGRKAPPGRKVGLHTHMDIAESRLEQFKQYIHDLDAGVIAHGDRISPATPRRARAKEAAGKPLELSASGPAVQDLQVSLQRLGYTGRDGRALRADGDFGPNTEFAVRAFQRDHHLRVDGRAGPRETLPAIEAASKQLLSHPSHPQHALYRQALHGVHVEESRRHIAHGPHSERLAGAMAVAAARSHLTRIDRVELNDTGALARGVQVSPLRDAPGLNRVTAAVDTHAALGQSLQDSSRQARDVPALMPTPALEPHTLRRAVP